MDKPDTSRRPAIPELLQLTEEERRNGLSFFADEEAGTTEWHETFEGVPAYDDTSVPIHQGIGRAIPLLPREERSSAPWQVPLLAAVVTLALVLFGFASFRAMRGPADERRTTTQAVTADRLQPARDVPVTAAASPRPAAEPVHDVPPSREVRKPVASREAPVRSQKRAVPAIASKREKPRIPPDSTNQTRLAANPRAAKPLPVLEPSTAPLVGTPTTADTRIQERPASAAPAIPPRAQAIEAPAPRVPAPETVIQEVLTQYRTAYRDLDAGAARAVWPSVDVKALRKAFANLEQQELNFYSCEIAVSDLRAAASCSGFASYVPRVGKKNVHDAQRQWEFKLSKVEDAWLIDTVSAR